MCESTHYRPDGSSMPKFRPGVLLPSANVGGLLLPTDSPAARPVAEYLDRPSMFSDFEDGPMRPPRVFLAQIFHT